MASEAQESGQALIELTLATALICTVLILATKASYQLRDNFQKKFSVREAPAAFKFQPRNDLIFFKHSRTKNLRELEESGWKFDRSFEAAPGDNIIYMSKDVQHMVVTDKLGVLLWDK